MTATWTEIGPELVLRAQRGDPDALRALVEAAYPTVRRWAGLRTDDPAEADDVTQEAMIQVVRKLKGFRGDARFGTWLYAVTRSAAAERARRERRRRRILEHPRAVDAFTPEAPPRPDAELGGLEARDALEELFRRLPLRQREVFDLVELQGLTSPEAAELLGIQSVSVRAHLFKARKALRALILADRPELAEEVP